MGSRIVLIDGHSIIHRAFYGIPDLTNSEGQHTNAVYGFLNIMFKILDEESPEYLAIAFDVHAPTFRHELYSDYKGTRKPMPEELRGQVPMLKEVLKAMGILIIEKAGLEADDVLGTISRRMEREGFEVSVISGDRDLLQLATDKIKIRIPKTKQGRTEVEDYYAENVKERYQITPAQVIEMKALMGDASDNIPGVPGIGEKTALKILTEFGTVENAYARIDDVKPPRAMKAMKEHRDLAELSHTLATIDTDGQFDFNVEDAKIKNFYTQEAYLLFKKLEFKNFLDRFEKKDEETLPDKRFKTLKSQDELKCLLSDLSSERAIGFGVAAWKGELLGISFTNGSDVFSALVSEEIPAAVLINSLKAVFSRDIDAYTLDYKLATKFAGLDTKARFHDELVGAYLLNPLKNDYAYEDIAREYLGITIPGISELNSGKKGESVFDDASSLSRYVCYLAYVALKTGPMIEARLKKQGMESLFFDIEMPLIPVLSSMENVGIRAEADELARYGEALGGQIKELEARIYESAGEEFNINSPKQLGTVLFERLGLPSGKKTKTGYSTAADVLEKLAGEYSIVSDILTYRQLTKLKSTYADGLAAFISADGRIHGTFNQTITATGRISSTEPNLQNIPVRMEIGRQLRKVFIPEEGCVFVDADYSQIELRILASLSGDENLIKAYKEAKDIHRITASQVFHTPFSEVTDLQRRNAKAVNFGIVYGISSFGLSQDLSISRKEAEKYIASYFATYPGVKEFMDRSVAEAKKNGYVTTAFGRRRPVPELSSSNFAQRSFGERVAMNSPIQGTAADIMKIAMIRAYNALKKQGLKARIALQVHDELLIETPKDEVEAVREILMDAMVGAADMAVPFEIDIHEGGNWLEAK